MTDSLTCLQTRPQLPLFVGRDLEDSLAERVERHLAGCAACRLELDHLTRSRARIQGLAGDVGTLGESLWPSIRSELVREGLVRDGRTAAVRGRPADPARRELRPVWQRPALRWTAALAAAAAIAALFFRPHDAPAPAGAPIAAPDFAPAPDAQLAGNTLRKAQPGETPMILEAQPLDMPLERFRRAQTNNPDQLWLVSDEVR